MVDRSKRIEGLNRATEDALNKPVYAVLYADKESGLFIVAIETTLEKSRIVFEHKKYWKAEGELALWEARGVPVRNEVLDVIHAKWKAQAHGVNGDILPPSS